MRYITIHNSFFIQKESFPFLSIQMSRHVRDRQRGHQK